MALAKDRIPNDSSMSSKVQNCVFKETARGINDYHDSVLEEEDGSPSTNGFSNDSTITHSPPFCGSGNGYYVYKGTNCKPEEAQSLTNFKAIGYNNLMHGTESLLSFQQSRLETHNNDLKNNTQKEFCVWENNLHLGHNRRDQGPPGVADPRLKQDFNCFQTATDNSFIVNATKEKQHGEISYGWLYSKPTIPDGSMQESEAQAVFNKRPLLAENMVAAKKQCTTASKQPKHKSSTSKDPQSIAAKNRRERISERLKILQELVPNGSKVDLVTMLEKAISYVKFLQLQVKVLATDEFWPVQGGKAPDISQVKEAIDAIISSQRGRNLSSK